MSNLAQVILCNISKFGPFCLVVPVHEAGHGLPAEGHGGLTSGNRTGHINLLPPEQFILEYDMLSITCTIKCSEHHDHN